MAVGQWLVNVKGVMFIIWDWVHKQKINHEDFKKVNLHSYLFMFMEFDKPLLYFIRQYTNFCNFFRAFKLPLFFLDMLHFRRVAKWENVMW